jgi:hypothetical protein
VLNHPVRGGSFALEWVATFPWNGWQLCRGLGGNLRLEYALDARNHAALP